MRARAVAGGVVTSAVIAAIGWQIGASQVSATTAESASPSTSSGSSASSGGDSSGTSSSGSDSSGTGSSSSDSSSSAASPSASPSASAVSGTFEGTTAETQFGPVQVEIVVSDGTITDVKALQLTDEGGRSVEISDYAAPLLRTEALSAQSANIQSISGATYTSDAYMTSLQAAIDKAGL